VVRLPRTLAGEVFDGWLITHKGEHAESIKTAWKAAVKRAGLDKSVRPYSLRHTAARWMHLQGVSADEVAQQLGHRKLGTTGVYPEYDPLYLKAACEALDRLTCQILASVEKLEAPKSLRNLVLPVWIEHTTSPLPRECVPLFMLAFFAHPQCHPQEILSAPARQL
jgi:Phage integrase family